MSQYIIAIDQGTTSTRSIIFNEELSIVASAQKEITQYYPNAGWVEHDPEELLRTTIDTLNTVLTTAQLSINHITSIGITNQRETILLWDKVSGRPIHNAIVWQDRRSAELCLNLQKEGHDKTIKDKTGLVTDPYFSGTKIHWLLENIDGAREKAEAGQLLAGTVDTWLIWNLTGGQVHATDATNASRTMLFNIHTQTWDEELLQLLNIPRCLLPTVKDCADDYGSTATSIIGASIPINGVAGDQHAATIGQACFQPSMLKATYGTGCFAVLNTGHTAVPSQHLLTTVAYRLNGETTYALEGSIFIAGAAVQWLRDGLKIIDNAQQTQSLAEAADPTQNIYLIPAFVGLGAPYWNPNARAALFGMTRNTGPEELAKATLESIGYQTRDLLEAMQKDWQAYQSTTTQTTTPFENTILRVDGGMSASEWTMQFLADILNSPVDRPSILETTALGAAYLAGLQQGIYPQPADFAKSWQRDKQYHPTMDTEYRNSKYQGWQEAIQRII